jgi:hypothetical protein
MGQIKSAWFGFFNQKNIEVLIFASHDDALEFGVPFAEGLLGPSGQLGWAGRFSLARTWFRGTWWCFARVSWRFARS